MKRASLMVLIAASVLVQGCGKLGFPSGHGFAIRPHVSAMSLTKGSTTTTENLAEFKMIAVTGDYIDHTISETVKQTPTNGIYFTAIAKRSGTGASASWSTYDSSGSSAQDYYWINENPIVFWSWYPYNLTTATTGILAVTSTPNIPTGTSTDHDKLSFTYTLPTHVNGGDATIQQDLVFAGNVESRTFQDGTDNITAATSNGSTHDKNSNLDIKFYHPLAKIQFGVDLSDGSFNKDIQIMKIEIKNVRSTGTCTFTAPSTFAWSDPATTDLSNTWSQSFGTSGVDFSSYGSASPSLPTDWPLNPSNSLYICNNAFFLIPQELPADTKIAVTFLVDGTTIERDATLPSGSEWKAGYYYTYKIKAQGSSAAFSFGLSLAEWLERENYIPII